MKTKRSRPRIRAAVFNVVAAVFCVLWLWAGSLPGSGHTAATVLAGVGIPFGVANLLLALMYKPVREWDRRVPQNERAGAAREQVSR